MDDRNESVVSHYITEFQQAATRSESGEDVTELVGILIDVVAPATQDIRTPLG